MSRIDLGVQDEQQATAEKAVAVLLKNLEEGGFDPEFQGTEAEKRRQQLIEIARHIPGIAINILHKFRQLTTSENLDAGKLAFFVVGGRVDATPIKDNTDFDVVITAEKRLHPKYNNISWEQRHSIGRALYLEIERLFKELGIEQLYERGIFEIKGLGERTSEELENEERTLKIIDLG